MRPIALIMLVSLALVAGTVSRAAASEPRRTITLKATVGPGFTLRLVTLTGVKVTRLSSANTYVIVVSDKSNIHNFRLVGPGVNRKTTVDFVGTARWTHTFRKGTFRFVCDPHGVVMRGGFTVS